MLGGVLTFAVAFAASCGLTVPIRRMALHWGIVDVPERAQNSSHPYSLIGRSWQSIWGRFFRSSGLWRAPRAAKSLEFSRLQLYCWWLVSWTTATFCIIRSNCLSPCPWRH